MKYVVTLNDREYEVDVDVCDAAIVSERTAAPAAPAPAAPAAAPAPAPAAEAAPAPVAHAGGETVDSPLPGKVLSVAVSAGQAVKAGQVMLVIEAMKMENEILAPRDCTVKQLLVSAGTPVESGTPLAVIG